MGLNDVGFQQNYLSVSTFNIRAQRFGALLSLLFLNVREILGFFQIETLWLTILLNFLLVIIIDYRYVKKELFGIIFIGPLVIYNKEILSIIDIMLYVYLLRDFSLQKIASLNLIVQVTALCFTGLLHILGVLQSNVVYMPKGEAYDFGMSNPSTLGFWVYMMIINLYLLFSRKNRYLFPLFFLIISVVVYNYCRARSVFIGSIVLFIFHYLVIFKIIKPFHRYMLALLPIFIYSVFFYVIFNIDDYLWLDAFVTRRFSIPADIIGNMSFIEYFIGIRLPESEPMDSSFMMILFNGGIGFLAFFVYKYYVSIVKYFNSIYYYLPVIISVLACGVIENFFSSAKSVSIIFWLLILYPCHRKLCVN